MVPGHGSLARIRLARLVLAAVALGCTSSPAPQPAPTADPSDTSPTTAERIVELDKALAEARRAAATLSREVAELRRQLAEEQTARASLEERYATLEHELAGAVEEVLRSTAARRGLHDRAFATSRISEVRVELESLFPADDPEVFARLQPARDLLARADQALAEKNYGGASYLAERASESIRRARIVAEIRNSSDGTWGEVIPIVPPRRMKATANANLRAGPALDEERIGGAPEGSELLALARAGEWLQVETDSGLRAWIHSRLAKPL
ncbi:MAG: SH3 domain-containing protein [Thermoanaerobaculia bacterium]